MDYRSTVPPRYHRAERVAKAVKDGLGIMPAFDESLSDEQIKAVAHYVARATGAAK